MAGSPYVSAIWVLSLCTVTDRGLCQRIFEFCNASLCVWNASNWKYATSTLFHACWAIHLGTLMFTYLIHLSYPGSSAKCNVDFLERKHNHVYHVLRTATYIMYRLFRKQNIFLLHLIISEPIYSSICECSRHGFLWPASPERLGFENWVRIQGKCKPTISSWVSIISSCIKADSTELALQETSAVCYVSTSCLPCFVFPVFTAGSLVPSWRPTGTMKHSYMQERCFAASKSASTEGTWGCSHYAH